MRIGIVVGSSSDLSQSFIQENDIKIMPVSLRMKGQELIDKRDPKAAIKFYDMYSKNKNLQVETAPYTVEQVSEWFLSELVTEYDRVLVLTVTGKQSAMFDNATQASYEILKGYRQKRREAGVKGSFSIRVMDTKNFCTAEAVVAYEAARLNKERKIPFEKWRTHLEEVIDNTHGFFVSNDLFYLRKAAKRRGAKFMVPFKYFLAKKLDIKPILHSYAGESTVLDKGRGFDETLQKLFRHAEQCIHGGLRVPMICMSYSGDLAEIEFRPDYQEFLEVAKRYHVKTMLCVMSSTAGFNFGPGGFTMGFSTT